MSDWDSASYLRFEGERTQPALDLANRVPNHPAHIVDLGCGPGNSTAVLRTRWPDARILGIDNSATMLARARETFPDMAWQHADIDTWQPQEPPELLFSNAVLHWLPNHGALFPRLLNRVAPGGWLAAQMPYHPESPIHRALFSQADAPEWRNLCRTARSAMHVETAVRYHDILQAHAARLEVWITTYFHAMKDLPAVLDWLRASGLRPYLAALEEDAQRVRFEQSLLERWRDVLPATAVGGYLLPFPRIFLLAQRR